MHTQSYVTSGDELLANTTENVDSDSGKEILYILFEVDRTRIKMPPAHARLKPELHYIVHLMWHHSILSHIKELIDCAQCNEISTKSWLS